MPVMFSLFLSLDAGYMGIWYIHFVKICSCILLTDILLVYIILPKKADFILFKGYRVCRIKGLYKNVNLPDGTELYT